MQARKHVQLVAKAGMHWVAKWQSFVDLFSAANKGMRHTFRIPPSFVAWIVGHASPETQ